MLINGWTLSFPFVRQYIAQKTHQDSRASNATRFLKVVTAEPWCKQKTDSAPSRIFLRPQNLLSIILLANSLALWTDAAFLCG